MKDKLLHARTVIRTVADKSDRAILFYSGGKDSIALIDLMAPHFKKVHLVLMYFVPGLRHIEQYVRWAAEKYPNVSPMQVPHWTLSHIRRAGIFCTPDESVRLVSLADIDGAVREATKCDWAFYGMKQADSINRGLMLRSYHLQAISGTQKAYPLSLWTDKEVLAYICERNLPTPINYTIGGGKRKRSSGVGFDPDVFLYLQAHYPDDLQKILSAFPLSQKILIDAIKSQVESKADGKA